MIDLSQHDLHDFWPSKQSMLGRQLLHMYVLGQAGSACPSHRDRIDDVIWKGCRAQKYRKMGLVSSSWRKTLQMEGT